MSRHGDDTQLLLVTALSNDCVKGRATVILPLKVFKLSTQYAVSADLFPSTVVSTISLCMTHHLNM
jgi:hypothetical protein